MYKTNPVELSVKFECPLGVLYDLFKKKPICLAAFLSCCNIHLSVYKHRTHGWMAESSQTGVLPGKKKNDRREKKVKEIARNNNSDKPWALSFKRKEVMVRKC